MGTPLHLAASQDQDQVMKILLEHGADVSCYFHRFHITLVLMNFELHLWQILLHWFT
jgi:ankyrin repeat protein